MSHTEGPWEFEQHTEDGHTYYTIEAIIIDQRVGAVADTLNRDHLISPDEDRANAILLAAAPEMLKLLKANVEGNPWHIFGDSVRCSLCHEVKAFFNDHTKGHSATCPWLLARTLIETI